ncbi:hypothetical protein PtB15_3B170 [Puccinia triticina]|nr:hypothetical protein PtB15_3B170 [Puccinia triticina]
MTGMEHGWFDSLKTFHTDNIYFACCICSKKIYESVLPKFNPFQSTLSSGTLQSLGSHTLHPEIMPAALVGRIFLFHLALRIACNASETPITLDLFPHRAGGVDDNLHSLAPPQIDHFSRAEAATTSAPTTTLSLGNFNVGENTSSGFRNLQPHLTPVSRKEVAQDTSGPSRQTPAMGPHEAEPTMTSQSSPRSECTNYSLLEQVKNWPLELKINLKSKPNLNTKINLNNRVSTRMKDVVPSSSKRPKNFQPQGSLASDFQPAKKLKIGRLLENLARIERSPMQVATDSPLTVAEKFTMGETIGINTMDKQRQMLPSESARIFNGRTVPYLISNKEITLTQQRVKKSSEVLKFDANVLRPTEEYRDKLGSILSVIGVIQRGYQAQIKDPSLTEENAKHHVPVQMLKSRRNDDRPKRKELDSYTIIRKRSNAKSTALKDFNSNIDNWIKFWEERIGKKLMNLEDRLVEKRSYALLLFYLDMIGTLLQKYHQTNPDSVDDPSLPLLKKAVELVEPQLKNNNFRSHKFANSIPMVEEEKKNHADMKVPVGVYTFNWEWISTVIMESDIKNLHIVLFQDAETIPDATRGFFNDIFMYSIHSLNQRLKAYLTE